MRETATATQVSREEAIREGGHPSRKLVGAIADRLRRRPGGRITFCYDSRSGRLVETDDGRAEHVAGLLREIAGAARDAELNADVERLRARRADRRR